MQYSEFIEQTGLSEEYITSEEYAHYIEPVYMESDLDKAEFCKRFYKAHADKIYPVLNMMIDSKGSLLESYVAGNTSVMADVEKIHEYLKGIFLKALLCSHSFRKECSI